MNDISLPSQVRRCLDALTGAGYSAHVVGGCVRDALLGRVCEGWPGDWDICTSALPQEVEAVFTGLRLLPTGARHGTLTLLDNGLPVEITTLRRDGDYADHRRPDRVDFTADLCEDLARRDFTVNAMAYHPADGLIDPFGGREDIAAGVLRCVGAANARLGEDALRILRLFRFVSQLGFAPDEADFLMP